MVSYLGNYTTCRDLITHCNYVRILLYRAASYHGPLDTLLSLFPMIGADLMSYWFIYDWDHYSVLPLTQLNVILRV